MEQVSSQSSLGRALANLHGSADERARLLTRLAIGVGGICVLGSLLLLPLALLGPLDSRLIVPLIIALLINIFNPELIILGGSLAATGDYIRLPIKSSINKYSLSLLNNATDLKMSKLGDEAGVIGACLLAWRRVLSQV